VKLFKALSAFAVMILVLGATGIVSWLHIFAGLAVVCTCYGIYLGILVLAPNAKGEHDKRAAKRNPVIVIVAIVVFTLFGYGLEVDFAPAEAIVALLQAGSN
jgi:flagellar motor component MotA